MNRTGIYPHGAGWRAVVSQGRNLPRLTRHFPKETALVVMQRWRQDAKASAHIKRKRRVLSGTLEADARTYLRAVRALPTFTDREREILLWVQALGHKRRDEIMPGEIREVRDTWIRSIPEGRTRPVRAATVNKRLRALSNLYRVLDGKQAYNPVRDVEEVREPHPEPRALSYETIQAILAAMYPGAGGRWKQAPPADWTPSQPSLARVRVKILAYTGLTPSALKKLTPAHVDLEKKLLTLPAREKGRGVRGAVVPLLEPAADAFRELSMLKGFGTFNVRSLRYAFTRAAIKAGAKGARLHDLRHSLGTIAYELTGSLDVVMALLQHASRRTTERYTMAAAMRVLHEQARPLVQHFGITAKG